MRAHAYLRVLNRLAERYTLADVTDHSPFAPYLTFDPSRGDMGLILEDERRLPVASMWVSFITAKGFIADSVPEMVLSVEPNWRGKGIGGWLIKQAVNYGRTHGWQGDFGECGVGKPGPSPLRPQRVCDPKRMRG